MLLSEAQAQVIYTVFRECGLQIGEQFQAHQVFPLETLEDDDPAWALHDALDELAQRQLVGRRGQGRRTWFWLRAAALHAYDHWAKFSSSPGGQAGGAGPVKALFHDAFSGEILEATLVCPSPQALQRLTAIMQDDPAFIGIAAPAEGAPNLADERTQDGRLPSQL